MHVQWLPGLMLLVSGSIGGPVPAGDEPFAAIETPRTPIMETVVVSGDQPGPGLWRVSNAEGHELWILGTLSPLPKRMRWQSDKVERLVARSQAVIAAPTATISADIGFFGRLRMIPTAMKAVKNPDGRKLSDLLPPELYERWRVQKRLYLGRREAVEKWRPLLAAHELFEEALDANGLSEKDLVWPVVRKAARRNRVEIVSPELEVRIEQPRQALKEFSASHLDDIGCLEATVARLESDLEGMKLRANAWAQGDLDALASLSHPEHGEACRDALLHSTLAEERGLSDLPQRLGAVWLEAAEKALADHSTTLAVLPVRTLLGSGGVLDALRERGYEVRAP